MLLAAATAALAVLLIVVGACAIGGREAASPESTAIQNNPGDGFLENATFVLQLSLIHI